ncbi:MAG: asparaginase [Candidatus Eremiobacteraeota bacterium]|uniref:L-asparaginase II n=1 Tax=mine drainage metagenome TaxID=410659 RepID=E6Q416_9ZZZZ|nr:asparaginase [Candidatus Eremiobacteraeota bacterium]NNM92038.1 asparaginase [Candidatus Eremiobacteraeota bacterium]
MNDRELGGVAAVEVRRGAYVESWHRIAACASDAAGRILLAMGEIDRPVYLRSAAKPFIAAAAIAAGVREAFGLTMEEIAVMAASHSGEPFHVAAVRSILHKIDLDESALQCGTHLPLDEASAHELIRAGLSPSAVHDNCSGKHAGILALTRLLGADPSSYREAEHPAQRAILDLCARVCDDDAAAWPLAIDGCGIPVFATPLRNAARAFARFATLQGLPDRELQALLVVRDAMLSHPEYVAGTGQFDTRLMTAAGGAIASKVGAEGVSGIASMSAGLGLALKVVDGASRARPPAALAGLRALAALPESAQAELTDFSEPILYTRKGARAGEIRARTEIFSEAVTG